MSDTTLTPRQLEVLSLHASGMSFDEIAERLEISYHSVNNRMRETRARLGALSLSHAVVICISRGYLCVDYTTADLFIPQADVVEALAPAA